MIELSRRSGGMSPQCLRLYAVLANADEHPTVRSAAIRILGRAGNEAYRPHVVAALMDASEHVRWDAAEALNRLAGPDAIEPLQDRARNDPSRDVRMACLRALRHYPRAGVVATARRGLHDRYYGIRHTAHGTLVAVTGRDLGPEPEAWAQLDPRELFPPPAAERPWWDLLGLTARAEPPPAGGPAAAGPSAGAPPAGADGDLLSASAAAAEAYVAARMSLGQPLPRTGFPLVRRGAPPPLPLVDPEEFE
jgi:hypothetical protein